MDTKNKKVFVKPSCIGCGLCSALCPNCFAMDDEGKAYVTDDSADPSGIDEAIIACPVTAIVRKKD